MPKDLKAILLTPVDGRLRTTAACMCPSFCSVLVTQAWRKKRGTTEQLRIFAWKKSLRRRSSQRRAAVCEESTEQEPSLCGLILVAKCMVVSWLTLRPITVEDCSFGNGQPRLKMAQIP
ncbi:hypothetical protein MHYP_G00342190 [Metynnis hypsauchen]